MAMIKAGEKPETSYYGYNTDIDVELLTDEKGNVRSTYGNRGTIMSDDPDDYFDELIPSQRSTRGVRPPQNEAQVDHIVPRSQGGTNSFSNARVISRQLNREKWDR